MRKIYPQKVRNTGSLYLYTYILEIEIFLIYFYDSPFIKINEIRSNSVHVIQFACHENSFQKFVHLEKINFVLETFCCAKIFHFCNRIESLCIVLLVIFIYKYFSILKVAYTYYIILVT